MNSGIYEPPEEVSDATTVVKAAVGSLPYVGRMGEELLDRVLGSTEACQATEMA